MSALNLLVESPFRPVDWRWAKATLQREDPRTASLLRHQNDEWTTKARRFQEALDAVSDDYGKLLLARRWPHLSEAHTVRFENSDRRLVRFEIEARLLTGEPYERIAAHSGTSAGGVAWYEKLFFSVSDRLDRRGWIVNCVIGESAHAGLSERDFDVLWKLYGYWGGPDVLDAVMAKTYDSPRPDGQGGLDGWVCDDTERLTKIKMNVAMRTMAINSYTHERISEIYMKFLELKKLSAGAVGDVITSNINLMFNAIPWTIGKRDTLVAASDPRTIVGQLPPELKKYDESSVEPRAKDLMLLSVGDRPAGMATALDRKFPEKPNENPKQ